MKTRYILFIALATAVGFTSCKKKKKTEEETPQATIGGTVNSPLTVADVNSDPNVPDYCLSEDWILNANVTIAPGVVICAKPGVEIKINANGSLNATGTAAQPIVFKGDQPTAGYWTGIIFSYSNSPNNKLIHCTVSDAGGDSNWDAAVYGYASSQFTMDNSTVTRSARSGILLYSEDVVLNQFTNVNVTSCSEYPVKLLANQVHSIDGTFTASNNVFNVIRVIDANISIPRTWKKATIPYLISGEVGVNSALTINPGATFRFTSTGALKMNSGGSLNAIGTAADKIIFTGEYASAGAWRGIIFSYSNSVNNIMRHCDVSFGGNDSNWDGNVYLYAGSQLVMGNTAVHDSQRFGLVDYQSGNTFTDEGTNNFYNNASGNFGN